ncbi:MAG: alanine--tRNA ligase [Bacteroidetes bacterium]|nr:MAG: alanine--tRNA ligase [Bacteroidota bacterium]
MKTSREIRQNFLQFFKNKGHQIVKSAPIVLKNDPTLMFTNAGMNQFKDIFLGLKSPTHVRVADTQKCLRVSGKHNDLEEVGHDTYHHTMFEMLGNWSFGDYYKQEATEWAWELLTKELGIDPGRLYVTIFEGDEADHLPKDQEAIAAWKRFVPEDRIIPCGKKDNFWEMGDTGPCGPCSEIHVDLRPDAERKQVDGKTLVNADHPEVIEIWNLVFIQFNRRADASLEALPQRHVDTGMGFERLVMVLQGKNSTYDIDLFDRSRQFIEQKAGLSYAHATEAQRVAMRVIIDHIRAIVFTIADGQLPSNTGAGYVIRRILRRAARYGYAGLGFTEPFMYEMVELLAAEYEGVFDEVKEQQDFIKRIIQEEEKSFLRKLQSGSQMFEAYLQQQPDRQEVDGAFAFKLYDTFGFPIDLTQLMARERGKTVDMQGFERMLEQQKQRSRAATEMSTGDWVVVNPSEALPEFKGYEQLELETEITQYRTVKAKNKTLYQLVLAETPFYAESGGQIGDKGILRKGDEVLKVYDTQKENELIVHYVDKLPRQAEGRWKAIVNADFRRKVRANHSATHLLHAALRRHLGQHVEQRGSLVSDKGLRFDFSHFAKLTPEELSKIEAEVNAKIGQGIPFTEFRDTPLEEAKAMGAMALFGEKYGDFVRVVAFDPQYSIELCGGTHVANTLEIRLFKITSEASVAAGVRRLEAITSDAAIDFLNQRHEQLEHISALLKSAKNPEKAVEELVTKVKNLEKELQKLNAEKVGRLKEELLGQAQEVNGLRLIRSLVPVSSANDLKQLAYDLKRATDNTLIVLGAEINNKPQLSIIMSDDLAARGKYHAGNMVRTLAKEIKGGGGGQPFFATAGGKDPSGLPRALEKVVEMI